MTFQLHHIFVCTSAGALEAEALLDAGPVEGSPNIHPGQGTANRRFFFENGFLELLWVHDELASQSALTAPTKLFDRWAGRGKTANPFGICFSSSQGVESDPPFTAFAYRPSYLPGERYILFADKLTLSEPEVFALSWPQVQLLPKAEPTCHALGLSLVGKPDSAAWVKRYTE